MKAITLLYFPFLLCQCLYIGLETPICSVKGEYFLTNQSHLGGSFKYPKHMFWLRHTKMIFDYPFVSGGL